MFFLFCSKTDREAIWLYSQICRSNNFGTEILFVEDLYDCKDWHLRLSNELSFAEVTLPNGTKINTQNVTLFLNRVNSINHPFWKMKEISDQQYFQQEWNAFLLGWLKAFEAVLVNKLSPTSLSGFAGTSLRWSLMAHKSGFATKPQSYLSDDRDAEAIFTPNISRRAQSLLVYNKKVFCNITLAGLSQQSLKLAASCHCNLLEIFVEKKATGGHKFISANTLPAFSKYSPSFVQSFECSIMKAESLLREKKYGNQMAGIL